MIKPDLPSYVAHRTLIAAAIEKDILMGRYSPGVRLTERELTTRFRVSSIPVREALQELEGRGLVVKKPNAGCSVVDLTPAEVEGLCRVRRWLEPRVTAWCCRRMTPEVEQSLAAHLVSMRAAAAANDLHAFYHEDVQFHRAIWNTCGVAHVVRILESTLAPLFVSGLSRGVAAGQLNLQVEAEKHQRIFDAMARRDGRTAARLITKLAREFEAGLRRSRRQTPANPPSPKP